MLAFKFAFKNLMGAGLRTWLNVLVLSFAFVLIIFYNGMIDGWNQQARKDMIDWEIGGGQLRQENYDQYDPFTIDESHAPIPDQYKAEIEDNSVCPILISQATVYPEGRMQAVVLKGIDKNQEVLEIPTKAFSEETNEIPVLLGMRMAKSLNVKKDDLLLVRWRDKNGTFDATEVRVVEVFKNNVPAIDAGQIWLPLDKLQEMTNMPNEATFLVTEKGAEPKAVDGWKINTLKMLTAEMDKMIQSKKGGASVLYLLLLLIALLAIFDTQVLSIFRRQKEIGTYIALGMTRSQVVGLFTVEGAAHSILAILIGAVYGVPLFVYLSATGIAMPEGSDGYGLAIAERIFPTYGAGLIIGTIIFVTLSATVVSYLPARKISKMKPTDALKGKLQ